MSNHQKRPPSYDQWRKEAARKEALTIAAICAGVGLLVVTIVLLAVGVVG